MEIMGEVLLGVLEAARGTPLAPTHKLNVATGQLLVPRKTVHNVASVTGTRAEYTTSRTIYEDSQLQPAGTLDLRQAQWWANLYAGAGVITTPGGGVLSRLHTHAPGMTADSQKSACFYSGDPDVQVWRAPYHMLDEYKITFDAAADEAAQFSATTVGQPWEPVADPTVPASVEPWPAYAMNADLWIDSGGDAIGTTHITGRLVKGEARIPRKRSRKRHANGAAAARTFDATGMGVDHAELDLTFEVYDLDQIDLFTDEDATKIRLRLNGDLIEGALYAYWQVDIYGTMQDLAWDTYMDTNRVVTFTIPSTYNADAVAAGWDWRVLIQNDRTAA